MDPALQVVGWWVAFAATHTLLSHPPVRWRLVHRLGERGYRAFYSLVAFATFVPLVTTFFVHRASRGVWLPALALVPGMWWATMVVNFVGILFVVLGFASPNPVSSLTARPNAGARGILRVTRHPGFMGFALLGLGHLLVLRAPIDLAFFGGLFVYPLLGAAHQDWRRRRSDAALADFYRQTSFFPFVAIWQGRTNFVASEFSVRGFAVAAGIFVSLFLLHHRIFG